MRRTGRVLAYVVGGGLALFLLLFATVLLGLETRGGQDLALHLIERASGGEVRAEGLRGRFPDHLRLARFRLADAEGPWLEGEDVALDLDLAALLRGTLRIEALTAKQITLSRLPAGEGGGGASSSASSSPSFSLPLRLELVRLAIARLALGAELAGHPLALAADGSARAAPPLSLDAHLSLHALGPPSTAELTLALVSGKVEAHLSLDDPAHGLAALWAPLLASLPLHLDAKLEGDLAHAGLSVAGRLGALDLSLNGPLDLVHLTGDLALRARSPDLPLISGLSWQDARLEGRIFGLLADPEADAVLEAVGLDYEGIGAEALHVRLRAGEPALHAEAELRGPHVPGAVSALLGEAPLMLEAVLPDRHAPQLRLDLRLYSALTTLALALEENETGLALRGRGDVSDLAPLGQALGVPIGGKARLHAEAEPVPGSGARAITAALHLDLSPAAADAFSLLGRTLDLHTALRWEGGQEVRNLTLALASPVLTLNAEGGLTQGRLELAGHLGADPARAGLALFAAPVTSRFRVAGPLARLEAELAMESRLALPRLPTIPFQITARAYGLPSHTQAEADLEAALAGAPLAARLAFSAGEEGGMHLSLDRLAWRSLTGAGGFRLLPEEKGWPGGELRLAVKRLADLDPLLGPSAGLALSGELAAHVSGGRKGEGLRLDLSSGGGAGHGVSWQGLTAHAELSGTPADPAFAGRLTVERLSAGAVPLRLALASKGDLSRLTLALDAEGRWQNRSFAAAARSTLDLREEKAVLESLSGSLPGARVSLAAPAHLDFHDGFALDRLILSWGKARLAIAGRFAPKLEASLRLDDLTPSLFTPFFPELAATGQASATARLEGSLARPEGRIEARLTAFHMEKGDAASLPPLDFRLQAALAGESAALEAHLAAGTPVDVSLNGRVPLSAEGSYALASRGRLDLALLDPVLTAEGRRIGGSLSLDVGITGSRAAPSLSGTAELSGGAFRDFDQGIDLHDISAELAGAGENLLLRRLSAKAGAGEISGSGEIGVFAPGLPVSLTLHAVNASPLVSETLTERLDADLAVSGAVQSGLDLKGRIKVARAEITIPDSLPPSVATIPVTKAGAPPPPPPAAPAGPALSLDLDLDAPEAVFVHGRGIDAELGGRLHIAGPATAPVLTGGLNLIRGQVTLGGTSLNFTSGHIGFEGGHRIDPALNLVATSSNGNVTATLTVGGFASDPKITLTSSPPLPQDEILAHLLFGTSASQLSAFQLASIAAGIAELSGATGGAGNAVNSIRSFLGLDRLTIGTPTNATPGPQAGPGAEQSVPTLEAGRYVAPGVYLGAKQSATGTNETAAELQINLGHGLRLDTTAGSGLGANSVGLSYQRQYGGGN
jgi:translocation and assembly module TamB